jgi:Xaa-Pro aminopeptidase
MLKSGQKWKSRQSFLTTPGFDVEYQPGMCVSLETSYMAAQGAYAPGPYNIEDSFAITEDGYDRFTTAPDSLVWDGSLAKG